MQVLTYFQNSKVEIFLTFKVNILFIFIFIFYKKRTIFCMRSFFYSNNKYFHLNFIGIDLHIPKLLYIQYSMKFSVYRDFMNTKHSTRTTRNTLIFRTSINKNILNYPELYSFSIIHITNCAIFTQEFFMTLERTCISTI